MTERGVEVPREGEDGNGTESDRVVDMREDWDREREGDGDRVLRMLDEL